MKHIDKGLLIALISLLVALFLALQANTNLRVELEAWRTCESSGMTIKSSSYDVKKKVLRIECQL